MAKMFEFYLIAATLDVRQFKRTCNQVQATSDPPTKQASRRTQREEPDYGRRDIWSEFTAQLVRNCVDRLGVMTIGTILSPLQKGFEPHLSF